MFINMTFPPFWQTKKKLWVKGRADFPGMANFPVTTKKTALLSER
jgi:hypothetical protein